MARSRDISKVLSSNTALATDAEIAAAYAPIAAGGLVKLVPTSISNVGGSSSVDSSGTVTFTTCDAISLNGIFSSTYQNYRIVLKSIANTTFVQVNMRLRASGSDATGGNYQGRTLVWGNDGGSSGESRVNQTSMQVVWNQGTKNSLSTIDVGDPFLTQNTNMIATVMCGYVAAADSNQITGLSGGFLQTSTSYDGFTFLTAGQNISGNIRVYGYRN